MLAHALRAASPDPTLQFVGGASFVSSATTTPSLSLQSLTGGIGSTPSAGDIVIVFVGFRDSTERNITCTTAGYTEVFDPVTTLFTQMAGYYKVLSSSESSVSFNIGANVSSAIVCQVWRNVNSTPLDANTASLEEDPNPPAIATVTDGAVVVSAVLGRGSLVTPSVNNSSGMKNIFSAALDSVTTTLVIGSKLVPVSSIYDPPTLLNVSSGTLIGPSVTMAIRPA